jgi:hypothetical protein
MRWCSAAASVSGGPARYVPLGTARSSVSTTRHRCRSLGPCGWRSARRADHDRWGGDWDQLATAVAAADDGFDAIICGEITRLSRRPTRLSSRMSLLAEHDVRTIRAAHARSPDGSSSLGERLLRLLTAGLAEHGHPGAGAARLS